MSISGQEYPLRPRAQCRRLRARRAPWLHPPRRRPRSRSKSFDGGMNEPPETSDPETCARFLRELGASGERVLPIAEAALALASFERPRVAFRRYRDHLRLLARDVGRHPGAERDHSVEKRLLRRRAEL